MPKTIPWAADESEVAWWDAHRRRVRNARRRRLRREGRRDPAGPVLVRCWVCLRSAWRSTYRMSRVVGRRTLVRDYGCCPRVAFAGNSFGPPDMCGGSMHRERERIFVLRAALAWDRRGMNRTSEFD